MRKSTRMLMMQHLGGEQERESEYSARDRRMIGFDREPDTRRYYPPHYEGGRMENRSMAYGEREYPMDRQREYGPYYGAEDRYRGDDGRWHSGNRPVPRSMYEGGGESGMMFQGNVSAMPMNHGSMRKMDEHRAREIVQRMRNEDGSQGGHWAVEQTEQYRNSVCPECKPWEFFVAMNMMYSDYCQVAKKTGVDKPEFYAHMAKAFLCDEDAKPEKLARYVEYVAE